MSAVSRPKASSQRSRAASSGPSGVGQGARSSRPPSKGSGVTKRQNQSKSSGDTLRAKEEEYRRLNAELEAKTTELVKEAEQLMKGNISILSDMESSSQAEVSGEGTRLLDTEQELHIHEAKQTFPVAGGNRSGVSSKPHNQRTSQRPKTVSVPAARKNSSTLPTTRPLTSSHQHPSLNLEAVHQDHVLPSSFTIPQVDPISVDIDRTVQRLERQLVSQDGGGHREEEELSYQGDDILPEAAEGMGPEATIRFLKAKLRVMQEEMDRLCQENSEKDKQINSSEVKLKELTEQNTKLQRSHHTVQTQMDKYKQAADTLKHKCEGLEAQLVALRKEVDSMKTTQKKAVSSHSALEVRLNRAMEEVERYKTQLQRTKTESKDSSKQEHQRAEQLLAENKKLERQKSELMTAFKKQLQLIDILKRQKMHIEAAKMLSFTEEEFVKALDWGTS